jgi:hypothetical protein
MVEPFSKADDEASRRPKTPVEFLRLTHQRLNMYAVAAVATGVGALVLVQPAEAKIVYTRANVAISPEELLGTQVFSVRFVRFQRTKGEHP